MHVNTYATEGDISMTLGQKICGFIKAVLLDPKSRTGQSVEQTVCQSGRNWTRRNNETLEAALAMS